MGASRVGRMRTHASHWIRPREQCCWPTALPHRATTRGSEFDPHGFEFFMSKTLLLAKFVQVKKSPPKIRRKIPVKFMCKLNS
jgi:hypothetical protein